MTICCGIFQTRMGDSCKSLHLCSMPARTCKAPNTSTLCLDLSSRFTNVPWCPIPQQSSCNSSNESRGVALCQGWWTALPRLRHYRAEFGFSSTSHDHLECPKTHSVHQCPHCLGFWRQCEAGYEAASCGSGRVQTCWIISCHFHIHSRVS